MASEQDLRDPTKRAELDERARRGETVVPGGTGGKSLKAQEQLAQGTYICQSLSVYIYPLLLYMMDELISSGELRVLIIG